MIDAATDPAVKAVRAWFRRHGSSVAAAAASDDPGSTNAYTAVSSTPAPALDAQSPGLSAPEVPGLGAQGTPSPEIAVDAVSPTPAPALDAAVPGLRAPGTPRPANDVEPAPGVGENAVGPGVAGSASAGAGLRDAGPVDAEGGISGAELQEIMQLPVRTSASARV